MERINGVGMARVIHTADTHIGYRQYHSSQRREDFVAAFEAVVHDAVESNVDAVLHAGDLFHDRRPDLGDLLATLSHLRTLEEAEIPFLAVVGNHESTRSGQWLDLFERLGLAVRLDDEPTVIEDVAFYGLDHVPESMRPDLEYEFTSHDAAHAALVAHGLFEPFAHADWDTANLLSESTVTFDALLAGDNHKPDRAEVNDTWVTYPGSTERASAAEREPRGYNLIMFGEEGSTGGVDIRRRALETRSFVYIEIDLAAGEGSDRVSDRLREHDLQDAVVIVDIKGDGDPVTPATVEEVADQQGALIARVNDRRERDDTADLDVSFADPDAAVRDRIDEMGLSPAALDIDETVRASKLADSNVREQVRSRVGDQLDNPSAFESAGDTQDTTDPAADGGGDDSDSADSTPDTDVVDAGSSGGVSRGDGPQTEPRSAETASGSPDRQKSADEDGPTEAPAGESVSDHKPASDGADRSVESPVDSNPGADSNARSDFASNSNTETDKGTDTDSESDSVGDSDADADSDAKAEDATDDSDSESAAQSDEDQVSMEDYL